jgi:hypothetical protein
MQSGVPGGIAWPLTSEARMAAATMSFMLNVLLGDSRERMLWIERRETLGGV